MNMKRLIICMMLSLALVVTFIPMISFAEDVNDENFEIDESVQAEGEVELPEKDGQSNEMAELAENSELMTKELLDNQISNEKGQQIIDAFKNQPSIRSKGYSNPVKYTEDGNVYLEVYYPEMNASYYLGGRVTVDFDAYDNWPDYYTIPVSGFFDKNGDLIDIVEGDIVTENSGNNFYGSYTLSPSLFAPGAHQLIIFNVPCDAYGDYVDGWDEWDNIPFVVVNFNIICNHSWRYVVQSASGYLKNGVGCNQCTTCGAVSNRRAIPGWSTRYVKSAKVKKGKGSLTVKWKKQNKKNQKKFDGYEIRYSTSGNINTAKAITVGKSKKSKKIGKLARKTTYYVWVSSYKNVNGVRNYSNWSWGTVKTK